MLLPTLSPGVNLRKVISWKSPRCSGCSLSICRLTLIPKSVIGFVTGLQQTATGVAGIVAPILSGWLLAVSGGYALPMQAIFVFLIIGALTTAFALQPKWMPRLDESPVT